MNTLNLLKRTISILPFKIERNIYWYKNRFSRSSKIKKWEALGQILPPPHQYKQLLIEQISKKYDLKTFVETGTFLGHMIESQRNNFLKLYSIEIEPILFSEAKEYFKPFKHIEIIQGDSAFKLGEVLKEISYEPILFWLDGHYSGENTGAGEKQCPIYEELETIFCKKIKRNYILIDDARCFDGTNDYPTLNDLRYFVQQNGHGAKLEIINDIIHIYKA